MATSRAEVKIAYTGDVPECSALHLSDGLAVGAQQILRAKNPGCSSADVRIGG